MTIVLFKCFQCFHFFFFSSSNLLFRSSKSRSSPPLAPPTVLEPPGKDPVGTSGRSGTFGRLLTLILGPGGLILILGPVGGAGITGLF
jgi:hypothetical protein